MKMEFHTTLKKAIECMGIQELKSKQIESIESFVSGRDTLFLYLVGILLYEAFIIYGQNHRKATATVETISKQLECVTKGHIATQTLLF